MRSPALYLDTNLDFDDKAVIKELVFVFKVVKFNYSFLFYTQYLQNSFLILILSIITLTI